MSVLEQRKNLYEPHNNLILCKMLYLGMFTTETCFEKKVSKVHDV